MHKRDYEVKRQKRDRIRSLLKMFLTTIAVIVIFFLLFYVRKIEVTGCEYTNQKEITRWYAADKLSFNSVAYLMKYKLGKVEFPSYLDDAKMEMKNPWTLRVKIKEKPIVAYTLVGTENVYFDKDGLVVLKKNDIIEKVPCIEGLDIKKATLYERLDVGDKDVFKAVQSVTEGLRDNDLLPDRIVWSDSEIMLYFGNICVQLGSSNFLDKIGQIKPVLDRLNGQEGILHLEHYGQGTSVISFEKPAETVPDQEGDTKDQELNTGDGQDEEDAEDSGSEDEQYGDEDQEQYNSEDEDQNQEDYNDDSQTDENGENE